MNVKVIVLDFDNCIVLNEETRRGSEEMKYQAWFWVFSGHNSMIVDEILQHVTHDIAGGIGDREDIVARICRYFGYPEEEIAHQITSRCNRFNEIVQEGIKKIGISSRTRNALVRLACRLPLYINTATPYDATWESIHALGITDYFTGVYCRPQKKVDSLISIIAKESIHPAELLFVDDQPSGLNAAEEIGCKFVGIHTAKNTAWHTKRQLFPIIYHLEELLEMI